MGPWIGFQKLDFIVFSTFKFYKSDSGLQKICNTRVLSECLQLLFQISSKVPVSNQEQAIKHNYFYA